MAGTVEIMPTIQPTHAQRQTSRGGTT